MSDSPVVVVGAGLAGLRAAEQLRAAGDSGPVVVVGRETHPPYNRPPLTKEALKNGVDVTVLHFRQRASTADVVWRLGEPVVAADLTARTVTLESGEVLAYRGLVVATGVGTRRLPLDAPVKWRHGIRTVDDAAALHEALQPGRRVVVLGAGFVGTEVAATATQLGCEVHVVDLLPLPLVRALGPVVGAEAQRRHEERGVRFYLGRSVTALRGTDRPERVELDDGTSLAADVVVEAVGSVPNVEWLAGNGLDLADGVACDVALHPLRDGRPVLDVVALGDVARFPVPGFGTVRIEHWNWPTEVAAHAARSLLAGLAGAPEPAQPFLPMPTFWTDQWGVRFQSLGMPHLGLADVRVLSGELHGECAVGYHDESGRLVGVVLIGLARELLTYRSRIADERPATTLATAR
ncbi:MAG TPA: FAD-dependent oxidoreductase [Lapillicoccus sp.]|nr:FAD-dependent oxidoreductase [Lapillicoccus sp.]